MDSPGDNTAVIRMKREFDAFVSASRKRHLQRSFNVNQAENDEETTSSSPAVSMRNLLDKEKEEKLMKAEVITAKSMIVKLEAEVDNLRRSNKRTRIEYDKDLGNLTSEKQRELEKVGELKSRLQYLADREKTAREELQELRRESELRAATAEEKQLALQKDKLQLEEDLQQANEQSWEKITELRNQSMRTQMELQICQTELEETKAQLKLQLKRSAETTAHLKELEDFRLRAVQAEQKIKDLEDQESLHQEDVTITRALKTQLENLPDLERELEKLKEENKYYKETEKNTLLLEEQIDGLTRKLQRAEDRMADYTQMQLDNESLKINLERWQGKSAAGVGNPLSPTELSQQVVELQSAQMLARDEYGKLQSRFHSLQAELRETTSKYQTAVQEASAGKTGSQQQQDLIKRLQRKLLLVSKEREGYKRILDSYESEVTVNVGALQASRVQQLEQLLHDYRTQTESLEAELGRTAHEVSQTKTKCLQLETQTDGGGRAALAAKCDQRTIQELKERVIELELEVEKKNRQVDVLEARIEQRKLQGDYDPSKTKVVHFTMNPAEIAQRHREEEMKRLQDENDKLKQRLKLLEESGGSVDDLTQKVEKKLQEPDVSKEVEELKSQLTREELRNKRLMEAFKKTSQEFREVCYQLTGYKIDIPCASQYRLTNMYADSPQDYLLFAHGSSGETQMLQTAFSETVQDLIDLYLAKQDSIPAFLSSVTLQLLGSRTMCVD
ncbi:mitotic spindle assembly checkpoint protein MAD1-like [Haliotis cracherodii]|uniref:mitotic spindle assembly checkpoint protein MAD1-like n=1 Tax=Haliotis cracherodii TaxID=6455 RepID=UPI0039E7ED49